MHPALPLRRFMFCFDAPPQRVCPPFAGNAWRGALGHALREAACLTGAPHCGGCPRRGDCAYAYVFETPPPADAAAMRLYTSAPHPFVLRELGDAPAGQARLLLTLVGQAGALLPLLAQALRQAACGARGIEGARLALRSVHQEASPGSGQWRRIDAAHGALQPLADAPQPCPPPPPGALRLLLLTPLRVKREGRTLDAQTLDFAALAGALVRRISMLQLFHTGVPLQAPFAELKAQARQVCMRSGLVPAPQQRYSRRQGRAMPMDGVLGHIEIDAADARPFWPFLWLGQFVHAGSAATMGLGCYAMEPALGAASRSPSVSPSGPHGPGPAGATATLPCP